MKGMLDPEFEEKVIGEAKLFVKPLKSLKWVPLVDLWFLVVRFKHVIPKSVSFVTVS